MSIVARSITLLLCVPIFAWGDDKVTIYGVGADSCGSLVQAFREGSPNVAVQSKGLVYSSRAGVYTQWLAGYVSAHSIYVETSKESGTDLAGVAEWVRAYCQMNPTAMVSVAAAAYVGSFEGQK